MTKNRVIILAVVIGLMIVEILVLNHDSNREDAEITSISEDCLALEYIVTYEDSKKEECYVVFILYNQYEEAVDSDFDLKIDLKYKDKYFLKDYQYSYLASKHKPIDTMTPYRFDIPISKEKYDDLNQIKDKGNIEVIVHDFKYKKDLRWENKVKW